MVAWQRTPHDETIPVCYLISQLFSLYITNVIRRTSYSWPQLNSCQRSPDFQTPFEDKVSNTWTFEVTFKSWLMDKRIARECLGVNELDTSCFILFSHSLIKYIPTAASSESSLLISSTSLLPQMHWFSISTQKRAGLPILCLEGRREPQKQLSGLGTRAMTVTDNVHVFTDWRLFVKFVVSRDVPRQINAFSWTLWTGEWVMGLVWILEHVT